MSAIQCSTSKIFPCLLLSFLFLGTGCASQTVVQAAPAAGGDSYRGPVASSASSYTPNIAPEWRPLLNRLSSDGLSGPDITSMFQVLDVPTQDPMGRKIKELYTIAFIPKPVRPPSATPPKPKPLVYPGVVTPENAERCREFIAQNQSAFTAAANKYGVPPEVAAALLFVETRLGTFLGKSNALYTLASMASSRRPEAIPTYLAELPDSSSHLDWITERMEKRSDWAYKELVALIKYLRASGIDPQAMPGSIYGAIGFCQFMPSNITAYGADGDGDGIINLFTPPDAIASLSNYLAKHGWNKANTRANHHKVIKTYNRIDIYANTILALSELIVKPTPTSR